MAHGGSWRDGFRALVPARFRRGVVDCINACRMLGPRRFESILYRADQAVEPNTDDLAFEIVESGQQLTPAQVAFVRQDLRERSLRLMLGWLRRDWGCVLLARIEGRYCYYLFCSTARRLARQFPGAMLEERAGVVGPGYTAPEFRGRGIHTRVMQSVVCHAARRGYGPLYGAVLPDNAASIRTMAKAGWVRVGVWAGVRALYGHWVRARRISD